MWRIVPFIGPRSRMLWNSWMARAYWASRSVSVVFINGMGRLCCSRSLRSEAGSELGAAPPEKEAEFPAVCSGGRGLLTPRNPEKNAAGSGGLTVCSIGSGRCLSNRGDLGVGDFFFYKPRGSDSKQQRSGTKRGWATSYRHGQGLRLPLQAAHHRWQR